MQRTLMRPYHWLLIIAAAALVIGAALTAEHHLKGVVVRAIAAHTGRQVRIDGPLRVQLLSPHPHLTAQKVSISNPAWMPAGVMAQIGTVTIALQWQFSLPPFGVRRLELRDASLHLAREASGRANWHLQEGGAGRGPPLIGSLSMPAARVELHDERRHLEFEGRVTAGDIDDGAAAPPLRVAGAGVLNGRAASFAVSGEPLSQARRDQAYHFSLIARSGGDRLEVRGFLEHALDFRETQATFTVSGPDLKDVYYLAGLRLPETGPYHISGRLQRRDRRFELRDLSVTSGQSDLNGMLTEDSSGDRPVVEGTLTARMLRTADLVGRTADQVPAQTPATALRVPDTPLRLSGVQHADWNVKLRVLRLELGPEALQDLTSQLVIHRGVLTIENFKASVAEGTVMGNARLDAARSPARAELNLNAVGIRLEQLLQHDDRPPSISGELSARVEISGAGKSIHEMLVSSNGTASAVVPAGTMRAATAQAASLDLAGAIALAAKSDRETPVRCGIASFEAHDGLLTARSLVVDTDKALITGSGEIHLDTGTLDLSLRGRPKHPSLTLHSAVSIQGPITHPQIHLDTGKLLAQGAAAAALGAVLTPVAAVLAFVNPGSAHNADCAALTAQAKASESAR